MPTQNGLAWADGRLDFDLPEFDNHYYEATDAFTRESLAWASGDIVRPIMRDNGLALVGHRPPGAT